MRTEVIDPSKDLERVERVARDAFGDTKDSELNRWFSFEEMKRTIKENRGVCCKAVNDNEDIVGMAYSQQENPINAQEGEEKWMIVIIAVATQNKSAGIGSQLLQAIEQQSLKNGAKKLFVYTNKDDKKTIGFYKKNGYSDAGWVKDYQYGKNNSAVFLLKYL